MIIKIARDYRYRVPPYSEPYYELSKLGGFFNMRWQQLDTSTRDNILSLIRNMIEVPTVIDTTKITLVDVEDLLPKEGEER